MYLCALVQLLNAYLSFASKEKYQQQVAVVAMALNGGEGTAGMTKNLYLFTLFNSTTYISDSSLGSLRADNR
jgi:hypothetical protein